MIIVSGRSYHGSNTLDDKHYPRVLAVGLELLYLRVLDKHVQAIVHGLRASLSINAVLLVPFPPVSHTPNPVFKQP